LETKRKRSFIPFAISFDSGCEVVVRFVQKLKRN